VRLSQNKCNLTACRLLNSDGSLLAYGASPSIKDAIEPTVAILAHTWTLLDKSGQVFGAQATSPVTPHSLHKPASPTVARFAAPYQFGFASAGALPARRFDSLTSRPVSTLALDPSLRFGHSTASSDDATPNPPAAGKYPHDIDCVLMNR
jgi:hypothetical protein